MTPAAAITSLSMLTCTVPAFPTQHARPIPVGDWEHIPATTNGEVAARLTAHGYAVLEGSGVPGPGPATCLAQVLGLGPAYIPPQYQGHAYMDDGGVTRITADATTAGHPAFGQTTSQPLHTDGTLQRIGEIKTTLMLCARPAASGGASQLFNAAGAFAALLNADPAAAAALTALEVLVRTSNLPDSHGQTSIGPAFAIADGRILSRYSVTSTDHYDPAAVASPAALDRALEFLRGTAQPGTSYYTEVTLTAGQVLLLANDTISHGRAPYQDSPAEPRTLYRALFTTSCAAMKQEA
ncbi:TauD/TfdA family dioxygenase [Frankia sp. R43]|uniref:TauD/TfdA family dioxygenase n=1 Tax=Frankia sp. R43 TaxID=269536 RepID=UPI0006CA1C3C|nr:TauD/TfdA family dioxygenase [Frankia sp. R43]